MVTASEFADWLQGEMNNRGWRQADLVREANINSGYLSQILKRERMPGLDICKGIARAFGMKDVDVARRAGLLEQEKPATDAPSLRELISKFSQLSDEDQESVLKHVRALDEMQQAEKRRSLRLKPKAG